MNNTAANRRQVATVRLKLIGMFNSDIKIKLTIESKE